MPTCHSKEPLNAVDATRPRCGHVAGRRGVVRALGRCGVAAVWPAAAWTALPAFTVRAQDRAPERAGERPFRIGGAGSALGIMSGALASPALLARSASARVVRHLGSGGSLRAVEQGALDAALISRPLQVDERMRGLHAFEYGRTPFALTTRMSGVSNLTRTQLAEMIEDPRAAWPDGTPVRLVLRPRGDGDQVLLASMGPLVELALERAASRSGMVVAVTDQEAADAVLRLRGGLGGCGLSLLRSGFEQLVPLALDGVAPTVANIENASYRIVNRMHVATLGAPAGAALELIDFLKSPDGMALLAQHGHSTRISR
jgi:phosphate transport system substrate-binding protein